MFNAITNKYLNQLSITDSLISADQKCYKSGSKMLGCEFYIGSDITFRFYGDAYLCAIMKWLQENYVKKNHDYLKKINIQDLCQIFDLPSNKEKNAMLALEMIEKIYA